MTRVRETPDSVEVICERCHRRLLIACDGLTLCVCGVSHTFVPARESDQ